MDFIFGLFTGLAFWPVAVIITWLIVTTVFVVNEAPFAALLALVVAGVAVYFVADFNPFYYVWMNPFKTLLFIGLYIVVGIGYSLFRWDWFVARWRDEYEAITDQYDRKSMYHKLPKASKQKARIINWMAWWPWSAFWWLCADFLKEMFNRIYQKLAVVYVRIADRRLAGITPPSEQGSEGGRAPEGMDNR